MTVKSKLDNSSTSVFSSLIGAQPVDVIVVGAGLTGLCAALSALERQARVVLVDQSTRLYANIDAKQSLYVNAVDPERQGELGIIDSPELFYQQTLKSGLNRADPRLVKQLCYKAYIGLKWIERFGITFESKVRQIPGGTFPRTCVGSDAKQCRQRLMAAAQTAGVVMLSGMRFESLIKERTGEVVGVVVEDLHGERHRLHAKAVIMATGGYAGDARMCARHDSRLEALSSFHGKTSDNGLRNMVEAGAYLVGMDFVELALGTPYASGFLPRVVHPLRHIMVNAHGGRVVNEENQAAVREAVLDEPNRTLRLVTSFEERNRLLPHHKRAVEVLLEEGVARRVQSGADLEGWPLFEPRAYKTLQTTVAHYNQVTDDALGKRWHYPLTSNDLLVLPLTFRRAVTLGGVHIDEACRVLTANGNPIAGLFAAGEVTGGVHGAHCVPGNLALESIVFGREAGLASVSQRH